jgi:cytochrome c553
MRLASVALCAAITLSAASAAGPAQAADPQQGRVLYETYCGTCHYEKLHERKATRIATFAALKAEVAKWAPQTRRKFTPAEIDDVAEHLNRTHYRVAK